MGHITIRLENEKTVQAVFAGSAERAVSSVFAGSVRHFRSFTSWAECDVDGLRFDLALDVEAGADGATAKVTVCVTTQNFTAGPRVTPKAFARMVDGIATVCGYVSADIQAAGL